MGNLKEIRLIDLTEDIAFFDDLREGNFVLVLGAGFSYGVPNKANSTIPIGDDFAKITKVKFNIPYNPDYSSAAEIWEAQIGLYPKLLDEFKRLFIVDETKFDFKLFSALFIPKWHNIFTLNFDNVLDVTQQQTQRRKLKIFSYPFDTIGNNEPNIFHLHGVINEETTLDKIVFTPHSYIALEAKRHDLYDVLHGDVGTLKKKILIIGSQFKELIVRTKFFKELPENKSVKIYHFDTKTELENVNEFMNRDYTFIKLEDEDGNVGTKLFLQFLENNKHKIRNISLEGAITVNQGFINTINKSDKISKSKFYSAKQDENCQWYGILNDYDIVRKDYKKIKDEVKKAFSTISISKVTAIIHGTGGCGKSTLLRRLALELQKETDFEIIWVKDRQLENFVLNALPKIQSDIENNYLVFVEDWYRLTSEDKEIGNTLLKTTQSFSNIRLVIGDRDIKGKDYLFNLNNPENVYELTEGENEDILKEIISKQEDAKWKNAAALVLQNQKSYNSPLFLILFAIAGVSEDRIEINDNDFTELENTVRRIARYDLKKISAKYPGFAKALHYWSCVYNNYKIFISYITFLQIADFYNNDKEISTYFKNWNIENEVLNKLKLYINVSLNENLAERLRNIDLIQFNHDKLAESVLSKVEFEGWEPYDDIQKRKLLNTVAEYGDDYSASVLLRMFLELETQIFNNNQEKKFYIDNLFYKKRNWYFHYLNYLSKLNLSSAELYKYLVILKKKMFYPSILWLNYFKICSDAERKKAISDILSFPEFYKLPFEIVSTAMNISKDDAESQKAATTILSFPEFYKLPDSIVTTAINISKIDSERKKAADHFLKDWQKKEWPLVYASLKYYAQSGTYPEFVINIVEKIINDYLKSSNNKTNITDFKKYYWWYFNLMKIPFHQIKAWKNCSLEIIKNWNSNKNRFWITNTLYCYYSKPAEIKNTCEYILKNWKTEITQKIKQVNGEHHLGDHIYIALGHPDLKTLSKKTAKEIVKAKEDKLVNVPDYLFEIAEKIITDDEFPEWNLKKEDEPITE